MAQDGKAMSSRLLTMKFMQRSSAPSPTTPKSSSPSEHSAKRQRLSNGSRVSLSDYERGQAALAEEELKRSKAIERQAAELGETKWVLSVQEPKLERSGLKIVSASFADIDASDDESEEDGEEPTSRPTGRISYGKLPEPQKQKAKPEDSDSSDDDEYDPSSLDDLIQEGRARAKQANPRTPVARITSISHNTSTSKRGQPDWSRTTCYQCGKVGHRKVDCPQSK